MKPSNRLKPVSARRIAPYQIITHICQIAGRKSFTRSIMRHCDQSGLTSAVRKRDSPALFDWLMGYFSMQGVSDYVAMAYVAEHGNAEFAQMAALLSETLSPCEKLQSFERFVGCGYSKSAQTCGRPELFSECPLPKLPLRKGQLNQAAFSLYLFMADICDGDIVGFIDQTLKSANQPGHPDQLALMRTALVDQLMAVFGISRKLIHMTLADLLIGCGEKRPHWQPVGQSMIAVDSLVHNFLHRSGILYAYDADHALGPACYGPNGCEMIIDDLARQIDARQFNRSNPAYYPRYIQSAIWRFCAEGGLAICNGRNIDDTARCQFSDCDLFKTCGRVPLNPA